MRQLFDVGVAALLLGACGIVFGGDWPQYRGANPDGKSDETIQKTWPSEGPRIVWKVPMGLGFSNISVAGGKAFCNAEREGKEYCVALNGDNGTEVWATPIDDSIQDRQGGDGPRSTPTVDGDRVYVLGTHLKLMCLSAADGKPVWTVDLKREYDVKEPRGWGRAASPVIDGDRIFVNGGGGKGRSLLAFDKGTGKNVWASEDDGVVHSSPTPATILGVRQIIFFTAKG